MPCAPKKMENAGSSKLPWRPVLKAEEIIKVRGTILSTKYLEFDPFRAFLAVFDLTLKVPFQVTRIEEMITN